MSFDALLALRKPDDSVVQVVEAAGLLLGVQGHGEDQEPGAPVYRGVPSTSIYGPSLRVLARQSLPQVLEQLKLLDLGSVNDDVAHQVFAKTLRSSFAAAGKTAGSLGLATPWASAGGDGGISANGFPKNPTVHNGSFADSLDDTPLARSTVGADSAMAYQSTDTPSTIGSTTTTVGAATESKPSESGAPAATATNRKAAAAAVTATGRAGDSSEVDAVIYALKLAVIGLTRGLMDHVNRLPLRNRPMAVLVDGSRMSFLALELAGAAWKFGRFVVVHVSCEEYPEEIGVIDGPECEERIGQGTSHEGGDFEEEEEEEEEVRDRRGTGKRGRWDPTFLREQLRETCLRQLEIPEESLELVFRTLPEGSSRSSVDEVTQKIDEVLAERRVEVVFMGCYGRRGPRVSQFGRVAYWALDRTSYQVVFAKKFSPSMVSPAFFTRPKRYLVAVTADLDKVSRMLDSLLPLVSPRDSVVLLHIMDESVEDVIAGETEDEEQVKLDLTSLLSNKRGLSHRVRVEKTGCPPEHPTQTVVQRIVKAAEEEAADFLAILYDESRGSYRTVATGCLRETRCGLVAIH